jgi:hypothetical protein
MFGEVRLKEFTAFEEEGRPFVQVTLELSARDAQPRQYETWILSPDQAYAAVALDRSLPPESDQADNPATQRVEYSYVWQDGRALLKREQGTITGTKGEILSEYQVEVQDPRFGPVPEGHFTLKAFGVEEAEIEGAAVAPNLVAATSWRSTLFWWPAGWAGGALVIGLLLWRRRDAETSTTGIANSSSA